MSKVANEFEDAPADWMVGEDPLRTIDALMYKALSNALAEMPAVKFDSTGHHRNKFASLGAIIEAARPVLQRHGLAVLQFPYSYEGRVGVRTVLTHAEGGSLSTRIDMPLEPAPGVSLEQVAGKIITYLRRYSYAAVLSLYAEEDTDGNAPQARREAPRPAPAKKATPAPKKNGGRSWPGDLVLRLVGEVDNIKAAPHAVNVLNGSEWASVPDDELDYSDIIEWAKARKDEST